MNATADRCARFEVRHRCLLATHFLRVNLLFPKKEERNVVRRAEKDHQEEVAVKKRRCSTSKPATTPQTVR